MVAQRGEAHDGAVEGGEGLVALQRVQVRLADARVQLGELTAESGENTV